MADLLLCQLLIMRTGQQFAGSAWLSYDGRFRRQATAYKLTDWSNMYSAMCHFYVSGESAVGQPISVSSAGSSPTVSFGSPVFPEARRSPSARIVCHSWNAGRCSSRFLRCHIRHSCDFPGCVVLHRRSLAHTQARTDSSP